VGARALRSRKGKHSWSFLVGRNTSPTVDVDGKTEKKRQVRVTGYGAARIIRRRNYRRLDPKINRQSNRNVESRINNRNISEINVASNTNRSVDHVAPFSKAIKLERSRRSDFSQRIIWGKR